MDCLKDQWDMQIQACTYEDHRALGPGQCPIVLNFNTDNNRESVETLFSKVPVKEILLQMAYIIILLCRFIHAQMKIQESI